MLQIDHGGSLTNLVSSELLGGISLEILLHLGLYSRRLRLLLLIYGELLLIKVLVRLSIQGSGLRLLGLDLLLSLALYLLGLLLLLVCGKHSRDLLLRLSCLLLDSSNTLLLNLLIGLVKNTIVLNGAAWLLADDLLGHLSRLLRCCYNILLAVDVDLLVRMLLLYLTSLLL